MKLGMQCGIHINVVHHGVELLSLQWRIQGGAWGAQAPPLALGTDFYAQDYNQ